jgi:2,3-dihydroxybenzoate-AMP ligase
MAACLSLREGADPISLDELSDYLVEVHGLETAKLPERLAILDELPLSAAGKIDKRWLREHLTGPAQ